MNTIITDCFDSKLTSLESVARSAFGLHNCNIIQHKNESLNAPLSTKEMEQVLVKKMLKLQHSFESNNERGLGGTIWFCTIQKGFLEMNKGWMLYAAAVFRKEHDVWFTGQTEATALKRGLWPFISLPDKQRYQKFKEFDPMLEFQPLIYYTNGIYENDWYKQALRNCIYAATYS